MIQPGLERIGQLLKDVQIPWRSIHVAGTNGKGSICHKAFHLLRRRHVRTGRFTSPHLIDRWDCIWINGRQVDEDKFKRIEAHYTKLSERENILASPFEILTATAFHLFNEHQIEIGVIEVGMGGTLDATNILNNQAISVISKIARDHEGFLGNTIEEIARHKAGILRPNVPYIINPSNDENICHVIDEYAKEIKAGPRLVTQAPELHKPLFSKRDWRQFAATLQDFQLDNVLLATIAAREAMKSIGKPLEDELFIKELVEPDQIPHLGRLQYHEARPVFKQGTKHQRIREILIDGAHNPDAAKELSDFVDRHERHRSVSHEGKSLAPPKDGWPVTWVLAMTHGKDAQQYLRILLKPGDTVVTTTFRPVDNMPWVKSMSARELLEGAKSAQPDITGTYIEDPASLQALYTASVLAHQTHTPYSLPVGERSIVLTGSLYLVGNFLHDVRTERFVPREPGIYE